MLANIEFPDESKEEEEDRDFWALFGREQQNIGEVHQTYTEAMDTEISCAEQFRERIQHEHHVPFFLDRFQNEGGFVNEYLFNGLYGLKMNDYVHILCQFTKVIVCERTMEEFNTQYVGAGDDEMKLTEDVETQRRLFYFRKVYSQSKTNR